jgi:hypothetical protein
MTSWDLSGTILDPVSNLINMADEEFFGHTGAACQTPSIMIRVQLAGPGGGTLFATNVVVGCSPA